MGERWSRVLRSDWTPMLGSFLWGQYEIWIRVPLNVEGPRWHIAAEAASCSALLWFRRRHAVPMLALMAVITAPGRLIWGASQETATLLPFVLGLYAAGRYAQRPLAYVAVAIGAGMVLLQQATDPLIENIADSWNWALLSPVPFAIGAWVRQRDELQQRKDAESEERVRAATAEERTRIAREVHDVLAHSIGVMVVQAEAAEEMLDHDPDRVARPLHAVQNTGRGALAEVRALLDALRADDGDPTHPPPTLADAEALMARVRAAGLPAELEGVATQVPTSVSTAAYRILQESLSNVLRHAGPARTRVRIEACDGGLELSVVNDGPVVEMPATDTGHGLIGMRERAQALGGDVQAGPRPEGGFRVWARLPITD